MADNNNEDETTNEIKSQPEAIPPTTKSGWLLKRSKMSRTWKKKWFFLKETTVFYGSAPAAPDDTQKSIALDSCEITVCEIKGKANTFCLRPKETQRRHFICAETETELQEWMQAICLAKSTGQQNSEGSQACVIQ